MTQLRKGPRAVPTIGSFVSELQDSRAHVGSSIAVRRPFFRLLAAHNGTIATTGAS